MAILHTDGSVVGGSLLRRVIPVSDGTRHLWMNTILWMTRAPHRKDELSGSSLELPGQKRGQSLLLAALRQLCLGVLRALCLCSGLFPSWNALLAPLPKSYSSIKALKPITSSRKPFWFTPAHRIFSFLL